MARYECPTCGGGFPDLPPEMECPWCGESMDRGVGNSDGLQLSDPERPAVDFGQREPNIKNIVREREPSSDDGQDKSTVGLMNDLRGRFTAGRGDDE